MSLNNIRLTPQLLAGLYQTVLIETSAKKEETAPSKTLGSNEKGILIIVKSKVEMGLPEPELQFLTSILAACKLTLADVAIINWNTLKEPDYKALLHQYESRFVLLFDVSPLQFGLPMDFPPFQIQAFDSRQYLAAPSLSKIQEHKGVKTELWNALKKLFLL